MAADAQTDNDMLLARPLNPRRCFSSYSLAALESAEPSSTHRRFIDAQTDNDRLLSRRLNLWHWFSDCSLTTLKSTKPSSSRYPRFSGFPQMILDLQFKMTQLENELDTLDDLDDRKETPFRLESRKQDESPSPQVKSDRDILMDALRNEVAEYDDVRFRAREFDTFQSPRAINHSILGTRFSHEELPTENRDEEHTVDLKEKWKLKQGRDWEVFDGFDKSYLSSLTSRGFIGRGSHWSTKSVVHREHQAITQGLHLQTPGSETTTTAMLQIVLFVLFCLPVAQAYPDQAAVDPDADRGWFLVVSFAMMSFLRGPMRRLAGLLMGASCVIGLFAQNDPSVPVEFGWIFFAMWILTFLYYISMADSPHVQWYIVTVVVFTAVSTSTFPFFESLKVDTFIEVLPICLSFVAFVA